MVRRVGMARGSRREGWVCVLPTIHEDSAWGAQRATHEVRVPRPLAVAVSPRDACILVRGLVESSCSPGDLSRCEPVEVRVSLPGHVRANLLVHCRLFPLRREVSVEVRNLFVDRGERMRGFASAVIWTTVSSLNGMEVGVESVFCGFLRELMQSSEGVAGFCARTAERCSGTRWEPCSVMGGVGIRMRATERPGIGLRCTSLGCI